MANDTTRDNRGQPRIAAKASDAKRAPAPKKRPHRWRLFTMLATLAVVVWFLPTVIAKTPLLAWILKTAATDLNGSVTVKSASLGWLSPIGVEGIEVKDKAGKQVLWVDSVAGDRRLAAILFNYSKLGKFTLSGTKLSVVMRDNGTNIEDLLAKYLAPKEKPSSTKIGLAIDIVDGAASITDEPTGLTWQIQKLSVKFDMADGPDGPIKVDVATDLRDARGAGKLSAGVTMSPAANEAKVSVAQFPLAMLRPLAARFVPGTTLTGRLSSEVGASWGGKTAGKNEVKANLNVEGFSLATPAMQTDVLQLAALQADCRASWQADRFSIEKSSIQCDFGNASLAGTAPLGGKDGLSLTAIMHQPQEFSGGVDLAKLAQLLPATLGLHPKMRVNTGQVQWDWSSRPEPQGTVWHGKLDASNLTATNNGLAIAWNKPIAAAFDAHDAPNTGLIVDRLLCESDFLHVEGSGTTDNLTAKLTFSLKQLADQLRQFTTKMDAVQLAGEGSGNLAWKRTPQQQFDAGADIEVRGFQLQTAKDQPVWREDSLLMYASAKGQTNFDANTRIDTATLTVKSGPDQIEAKLLEPVKDLQGGGVWRVWTRIVGQLQNWPPRLAAWWPAVKDWQLNGGYILEGDGVASKDGAEVRQIGFAAEPLIVKSAWLNVNETRVAGAAAGSWSQKQRRLQLPSASISCATAAVTAKNVDMALPAEGPLKLAGTVDYEGDAGRIRQWFADPKTPPTWRLAGQLKGSAELQQTAGVMHGATTAELTKLAVVDSSGKQFQEPAVQLYAKGDYDSPSKTFQLTECKLTSSMMTAAAAGRISPVSGQNNGQLEGSVNYDLERLTALLRPCLGPSIRVAGRGSSSAWYRGPFALDTGSAAASFHWDDANLYGVPLGQADLKATMAGGVAQIEPLDLAVGGGRVHLAPRLRLTSDPMEFSLPKGPLAQKIQIDPAMCGSMLQYIAPVLAGVTTAQGTFSIDLDDCRIPIGDLNKANVTGRFTIHSVAIGPGPMIRQLAVFMNRETPAQLRQESVVPFQMVKGRVYHDNLELIFPDITIRTRGSVGVSDQTLDIMAQMPVPPKWQAGNTMLSQAMRNQTISVPLRGTLAKPALDQKVVQELTKQFMQKAAGNIIEGELNKLFTPRK